MSAGGTVGDAVQRVLGHFRADADCEHVDAAAPSLVRLGDRLAPRLRQVVGESAWRRTKNVCLGRSIHILPRCGHKASCT